jgi:hypothetical protein
MFGMSAAGAFDTANAQISCGDSGSPKEFHISIDPSQDELDPIPPLSAVGGRGEFELLQAQQASPDGYRFIQITRDNFEPDGLEAELISADFNAGSVSFRACSNNGFLILAGFRNASGEWAGFPAGVISAEHQTNIANLTEKLDERIGSTFRTTGADETLAIAQSVIEQDFGISDSPDRRLAQLILTQNASAVFDLSGLQAPVFNFSEKRCEVTDNFIRFSADRACSASVNAGVADVLDEAGNSIVDTATGRITIEPNATYVALIEDGTELRTLPFGSILLVEEPEFTIRSCGLFSCNDISLPYAASTTTSTSVIPQPEWFDIREYTLTVSSGQIVVEDILANVVSGPSDGARIAGLSEGPIAAGETISFSLQTRRSTSQSLIEFGFNVSGIDGNPRTFFVEARVTTN